MRRRGFEFRKPYLNYSFPRYSAWKAEVIAIRPPTHKNKTTKFLYKSLFFFIKILFYRLCLYYFYLIFYKEIQ